VQKKAIFSCENLAYTSFSPQLIDENLSISAPNDIFGSNFDIFEV